MRCPDCGGDLKVYDNAYNPDAQEMYRKRRCARCGKKICTLEYVVDKDEYFTKVWLKYNRCSKQNKLKKKQSTTLSNGERKTNKI